MPYKKPQTVYHILRLYGQVLFDDIVNITF